MFWHKIKIDNFDPYNVLLAIATNILMLLMTGFVVQGYIFYNEMYSCNSKDEFTEYQYADLVLSYLKVLLSTFKCILQCLYINIIKWK